MRAMWKGSVAFGLVNVPIKLYAATEDHDVRFHQVHAADGGRVKMLRTCSVDGQPVEFKDLAKAYESQSGQVVVMEDKDFEGLPVPGVKEIEVLEFVPAEQVDPILFDRSYYLEPEARALKPYVLLREALARTERMALVRVVLRQKTQLAALRVRGDVLVLQTMLWPDEVRAADFDVLETEVDLRPQELSMASSLIDSLSSDFDPGEFHDEYREALLGVIDRKLAGGRGIPADAISAGGDAGDGIVLDLMAALRESVQRNQGRRTAAEAQHAAPTAEPKVRRTARRSTAANAEKPPARATKSTSTATTKKAASEPARKSTTAAGAKKPTTATKADPKAGRRRTA
jgi:DNA end-binding protein Ku